MRVSTSSVLILETAGLSETHKRLYYKVLNAFGRICQIQWT